MLPEDIDQLVSSLEAKELESLSGVAPAEVYSELFAAYLFQNELSHARFLWKRIPAILRNPELEQLYKVFETLWHNRFTQFYVHMNYNWSPNIAQIMAELKNRYQQETINLIASAYTSVSETKLAEMTNQSPEAVNQLCSSSNWELIDGSPRMILPKKPVSDRVALTSCEDQMKRLTEFVSFLES